MERALLVCVECHGQYQKPPGTQPFDQFLHRALRVHQVLQHIKADDHVIEPVAKGVFTIKG